MIKNQSFIAENFAKIFYMENRKGESLERKFQEFKPLLKYTKMIQLINNNFNAGKYLNQKSTKANLLKDKLKKKKYEVLFSILQRVEENIIQNKINFAMTTATVNNKTVYKLDMTKLETYLIVKQLQFNIADAFEINMPDRNSIVGQLVNIVGDFFPKILLKTDIHQFYESIPHNLLLKKISDNINLNVQSKKLINNLLNEYKSLTSQDVGIPRGVGISAFLSELYMQEIDKSIKSNPDVTYYARYVDDIIIVFTPYSILEIDKYFKIINKLVSTHGFKLNRRKTKIIDLPKKTNIDFLGYNFSTEVINENTKKEKLKLNIKMSKNKIKKYQDKIDKTITDYLQYSSNSYGEKNARKLLINRIRYLTGNFKLYGTKKDIVSGIYFSNKFINNFEGLDKIDHYYNSKAIKRINGMINGVDLTKLQSRLKKYSFKNGFDTIKFYCFEKRTMQSIQQVWKNI